MKLIYHITLLLWLAKRVFLQKFSQDQYPFPPQFKIPNSGVFGSDSSIYLPPESHTNAPYFAINNGNKLPYQFLPPTATKIPSIYPTPFPMVMSSTMISHRNEEDDEDEEEEITRTRSPQVTSNLRINNNQTAKHIEHAQEKNMRTIPKMFNNNQNPIDRIDIKFPPSFHSVSQKPPVNQDATSQRRMIISSEVLRNDHGLDQVKRASILSPQLLSSPIAYYSTTEPAIPILRLSNEMDLDGSFSYEALGADQTHYVQHSRMENSGTDKEEQVVEGSYSYVGDNGQTYTVHYVADSNGYRASGDHLPVPPPIPEIIQRAVQYNLAEEAKKPPHLKTWQENEREYEQNENEKHRFSIPPPRNLFTGRTPEAFSFGLTQISVPQNNIPAADNSQIPVKTNFDFSSNQSKSKVNNGPIAPQITFLASQGAHNPSVPSAQQQISRIFATEKPTLPQLMKYEAGPTESDQENNKALWRWQYGLNTNAANENQHTNKNSISRSFGEGDDVIINFNNMSPEQYTNLMKNEFMEQNTNIPIIQTESYKKENEERFMHSLKNENSYINSTQPNEKIYTSIFNEKYLSVSTENNSPYISTTTSKGTDYNQYLEKDPEMYPKSNAYVSSTPLATQPHDFSDNLFESTKIRSHNVLTSTESPINLANKINQSIEKNTTNSFQSTADKLTNDAISLSNSAFFDQVKNVKFTDFIQKEDKNDFKPITYANLYQDNSQETTTAEPSPENIIRENIFLKNLFKSDNINLNRKSGKIEELQKPTYNKLALESKFDKIPKFIQYQSKSQNEIKNVVKKPLDITDVLNYMTFKNYFESNKVKSKNKYPSSDKFNPRIERPQIFIPLENDKDENEEQMSQEESYNHLRPYNNQKQQELRGIIKNYKVLQRNNNTKNMGQNRDQFLTDASSRHLKTLQTQNLPPLGRAGPSTKSYLPPTYV